MHRYDTVLKDLLQGSENSILRRIARVRITRWLNTELPIVRQTRMDMLGEVGNKERTLVELELQSKNDQGIDIRMADYSLGVRRKHGRFPEQYVLYVGAAPMNMPRALMSKNHKCYYDLIDIRELDSESLLNTPFEADAIMAILARYKDRRETIRRVLERVAKLKGERRAAAFSRLFILAGLRKMEDELETEARQMPITENIMDHKILGPAIRKGRREGREKGLQQGLQQGRREEGIELLEAQITKRFGELPGWAETRLKAATLDEIKDFSLRLLEAKSLAKLFKI